MKIYFHGAARTVTGSKHLIHYGNKQVLLDCGMFQGHGQESDELNRHLGFNPLTLDAMILSHAHIDHAGLIPRLVAEGYKGPIYCTSATYDLCTIMLEDSAHIQESDVRYLNKRRLRQGKEPLKPIYTSEDVAVALKQFVQIPYHSAFQIDENLEVMFTDAGHILGSAIVNLKIQEAGQTVRVAFTGDLGRLHPRIIKNPEPFPQCDVLITESTYGDRLHDEEEHTLDHLLKIVVETCVMKKGKLIIPAFSVGRTQEIVYALDRLSNAGQLPQIPVYVDSPLSTNATNIMRNHPECFNESVQDYLEKDPDPFGFARLTYIREAEQSKKLNGLKDPCIIISASGMAEAGRIKHHIANNISNPSTTILIVGHCEQGSLGARLARGDEELRIFGELYQRKAHVEVMGSFSAHGDYKEMLEILSCQDASQVRKTFLVHGEYDTQLKWEKRLNDAGFKYTIIPEKGEEFRLA
jgi:metallo-beta-lactamase family protein